MEFPAFAYYQSTQIALAFITYLLEFLLMFMVAGLILTLFNVSASKKQRALFAFLAGAMLQSGWSYAIYFLQGMVSFSRAQFMLITTPNPIAALLYCWLAINIFKLSPVRSVKMMSYVYLFWCLTKNMNKIFGAFLFIQDYDRWNYLLDIMQQCASFAFYFIIYCIVRYLISHKKINIMQFTDNRFFHQKKDLLFAFLKVLVIYVISVSFPILMNYTQTSMVLAFITNILFFVIIVAFDMRKHYLQVIENNNVHISTLFNSLEEFRGIKHDFYNILQTYSGYLELRAIDPLIKYHYSLIEATTRAGSAMELSQRTPENPPFVSLLMSKLEYANSLNVTLHYALQCNLSDFYIDNMDMCRMLACLLDNAIESAAESTEKKMHFSVESKPNSAKLLILTNSTDAPVDVDDILHHGTTNKEGHSGIGLTTVRSIIGKYGNCTFQMKYYNFEVSAYLEVKTFNRLG